MSEVEQDLQATRPSTDARFAARVQRLIRPEALKQRQPSLWSPGLGPDVWDMFVACIAGDLNCVQRLVARDPSQGNVESAALYMQHGADLHARDEELSSTPLGHAAHNGQARMVEFLLRRGARPSLPDDPAWATPLAWATRRGNHEIVELLTEFERSGKLPAHTLARYETLVAILVDAYVSGDEAAVRRVMELFQITRHVTWDQPSTDERLERLRRCVRCAVAQASETTSEKDELEIADAQLLIARLHGFATWAELKGDVEA
jgi:Ankyrin repeats (3 copies)